MHTHRFVADRLNLKKIAVALSILFALILFVGIMAVPGLSQEAPATVSEPVVQGSDFVVGIRLLHDSYFYAIGGIIADDWDALVGIGFNNGFWVGAHAMIALDVAGSVNGYGGLEITIVPQAEDNDWRPSIPIGFSYRDGRLGAALGANIYAGKRDKPVDVGFFVQFTYSLGEL